MTLTVDTFQSVRDAQAALRALWPDRPKVYFVANADPDGIVLTAEEQAQLSRVATAIADARSGAQTAAQRVVRVQALHRCDPHGYWCAHDGEAWPCPTRRVVDGPVDTDTVPTAEALAALVAAVDVLPDGRAGGDRQASEQLAHALAQARKALG